MITKREVNVAWCVKDREDYLDIFRRELAEEGYVSSVWVSTNLREKDGRHPTNSADQVKRLRKYAEKAEGIIAVALVIDGTPKVYYPKHEVNRMLESAGCTARVLE